MEPVVEVRALSEDQVADLIARLRAQVVQAQALSGIHVSYAAEANAYRQVLATIADL